MVNANEKPRKVVDLCNTLEGTQFLYPLKPGMIKRVGWHAADLPLSIFYRKNYLNRHFFADQLFFVKVRSYAVGMGHAKHKV